MATLTPEDMETLCLSTAGVLLTMLTKKERKREKWTKDWLLKRQKMSHMNILSELLFEKGDWFNYIRMDHDTFCELLSIIKPIIEKQDACMITFLYSLRKAERMLLILLATYL